MAEGRFIGYADHVDSQIGREEAHALYYTTQTQRLQKIMEEVNLKAVFDWPQNFLSVRGVGSDTL